MKPRRPEPSSPQRETRKRHGLTPGLYERTVLVWTQATKSIPGYRKGWDDLARRHGESALKREAHSIRTHSKAGSEVVRRDLLELGRRYFLPVAPCDPHDLKDLPEVPQKAVRSGRGWSAGLLGVRVHEEDGPASPRIARLDLDLSRIDRELLEGIRMVRLQRRTKARGRAAQLGIQPVSPQPGLVEARVVRVDVELDRPDEQLSKALRFLRRELGGAAAGQAVRPKFKRLLRSRAWAGDMGFDRAFRLRDLRERNPKRTIDFLLRMEDPDSWNAPANLARRKAMVSRAQTLLALADAAVQERTRYVELAEDVVTLFESGKHQSMTPHEAEAEIRRLLAEGHQ